MYSACFSPANGFIRSDPYLPTLLSCEEYWELIQAWSLERSDESFPSYAVLDLASDRHYIFLHEESLHEFGGSKKGNQINLSTTPRKEVNSPT